MQFKSENNPFTLQFSYIPPQYISRKTLTDEIVNDLKKKTPAFRGHFLTGVRGSGKSVMMADIYNIMHGLEDWVTVDIENPECDILDSLARGIYRNPAMKTLFLNAKLDISVLGLGVSVEKANLVASNASDAVDMMLKVLKREGKKLLITIDEVTYCHEIAAFSHALSAYARAGYEVYVLMTGLKENIKAIKNDKSLTFLYRAKEHTLEPLNTMAIIADYVKVFGVNREAAEKMAWNTKGYSFAFQVLGYLYWEALCNKAYEEIDEEDINVNYDQYLSEFVYEKIWSELPTTEKKVLRGIADTQSHDVKTIRENISMNSSKFSVYRNRLMERGLIDGREYGKVKLVLPRFDVFIKSQEILE